ncbi:hypothetical protein BDV93DRAFT_567345 [Ceratobasidium sp. AG-I]|nr:hypothetical protein BDV93DRAFT_567366 [Ceratobasidium sp. AG-I]KAF8592822.1 hypothetical protein BDV93DRAFT_567345 [Ceratobasidium sp. AG-I]
MLDICQSTDSQSKTIDTVDSSTPSIRRLVMLDICQSTDSPAKMMDTVDSSVTVDSLFSNSQYMSIHRLTI